MKQWTKKEIAALESQRALVLVVSALRSARLARVAHAMRCATRSREYARTEAAA